MRTPTRLLLLLGALTICGPIAPTGAAEPAPQAPEAPARTVVRDSLEAKLMGTWMLVEATTPGNPSGIGTRQKTYSPGRWEIIQKDPKTGEVIFHHGGSYRIVGDIVEQKVEFAGEKTKSYIGRVSKFRVTVEKDTYIQVGIGNQFNEVWKRADSA